MNSLASDRTPAPGVLVAGRFRLVRMLGQGGMGSVWAAHHTGLDAEVAVKFIDPDIADRAEILSRFAQEAMAAAKIKSPHVVGIFDHGIDDQGRAFIAMELLKGEDLATRLERVGKLPLPEAADIIRQAAKGLAKAHAAGVVHRDLKPENIYLCDDDEGGCVVKILDFGIAKSQGPMGASSAGHKTATGQIIGTPMYMSPEQALGRSLDPRSDLYSLAVVAYRCVAGRPPFVYDAVGELIVAVSTLPSPPASSFSPELPQTVDAWFERALQKDPAARFPTARVLGETFAAACEGQAPSSEMIRSLNERPSDPFLASGPTVEVSGPMVAQAIGATTPSRGTSPRGSPLRSIPPASPRTRVLLGVAGVLGVAIVAAGAAIAVRGGATGVEVRQAISAATTNTPAPPPEPLTVSVRVAASPSTATLFWDGQPMGQNPFSGARPRDTQEHKIRAEAAGYRAAERVVSTTQSIELVMTLDPLEAALPSTTTAVRSGRRVVTPPASAPVSAVVPTPPPSIAVPTPPPAKSGVTLDKDDPWNKK